MATERMSAALHEKSQPPYLLAKKARTEIRSLGSTAIRCPKCGSSPEITTTPRGERTIVSCKCGYLHYVDINF